MKYELKLDITDDEGKFISFDTIKSENLIKLLVQFQFVIVKTQQQIHEIEIKKINSKGVNDDIPF